MSEANVAPVAGEGSTRPEADRSFPYVRAWAGWMAAVLVLVLLADVWTEAFEGAGRVLLAGMLLFHLVFVPGRGRQPAPLGALGEAACLALATLPLAEIVRGMTGGTRPALLRVAGIVLLAHLVGLGAGAAMARWPRAVRAIYWPLAIGFGAALPLAAYVTVEFLGSSPWPMDGALLGPVVRLLDAGP